MRAAQQSARADRRLCGHGGGADTAHRRVQPADPRRWNLTRWNLRWGVSFRHHPATGIHLSRPGLGPQLAARVLGEFGDAPHRYATAKGRKNHVSTSPIPGQRGSSENTNACCASTSRREPTSAPGPPASSTTSPPSSTTGHASASATRHRTKPCNDGRTGRHDDDSQRSLESAPHPAAGCASGSSPPGPCR
jgi:hypothetical protein